MSDLRDSEQSLQTERHDSNASSVDMESPDSNPLSNTNTNSSSTSKVPPPTDKTISCVSCRKRKLKCDRVKPKCGTCTRLRHDCEFPERKRNMGSRRRNMKELEARLAQVETQLTSETKAIETKMAAVIQPLSHFDTEPDWNAMNLDLDLNMNMGAGEMAFDSTADLFSIQDPINPAGDFFSTELIALGLQEPLPAQDVMDELTSIYFETVHRTMPIMHKYRFYASLDRGPHMRPPVSLRYAMWTVAASITDKYLHFEDILYERTRRYLQQDEMKGHGESFVSIYYVQAWAIIATYEATKTYFSRSWMSSGRCVRLAHMLGLHRLDAEGSEIKRILPIAKDWIELEERRRGFWIAFYVDRWASSGTGWPMIIDEEEIMTQLPSTEEAFENGVQQPMVTLAEALTPNGAGKVSTFGGIILSATLFGHNFRHLHKTGPNERPEDLDNGDFWKRHRKMDNVLSATFMFFPDHLRLPAGLRDSNIPLIHMNIHASTICLHQAAILTAEKHQLPIEFRRQCRNRSYGAAEEIVSIMRMISHFDVRFLSSWTGFCLYVAAGVLVQDKKLDPTRTKSLNNLDFLLDAMRALGKRHSITDHFTAQLELDIEASGIRNSAPTPALNHFIPNTPINGILAERQGQPMAFQDLQDFANTMYTHRNSTNSTDSAEERIHRMLPTPMTAMPASSRGPEEDKLWEVGTGCPSFPVRKDESVIPITASPKSQQSVFRPWSSVSASQLQFDAHNPPSGGETTSPSDQSTPSNINTLPIRHNPFENGIGTDRFGWEGLSTNIGAFQTPVGLTSNDVNEFGNVNEQDTAFATGFSEEKPLSVDDYSLQYQEWRSKGWETGGVFGIPKPVNGNP